MSEIEEYFDPAVLVEAQTISRFDERMENDQELSGKYKVLCRNLTPSIDFKIFIFFHPNAPCSD